MGWGGGKHKKKGMKSKPRNNKKAKSVEYSFSLSIYFLSFILNFEAIWIEYQFWIYRRVYLLHLSSV